MKKSILPRVQISFATGCFYLALIVFEPTWYTFLPLLAAALHEGGHLVCMLFCRRRVDLVRIYPFGIDICSDASQSSYRTDLCIALAGAVTNLLFLAVALLHSTAGGWGIFAASNLLLAVVNLFPVRFLDGGEAVHTVLLMHMEPDRAEKVQSRISFVAVLLLWLAATYLLLLTGYNFSLFAMAVYLFAVTFLSPSA